MFSKNSFSTTPAQAKLSSLLGTFAYPKSGNVAEINDILEKVIFAIKIYGDAPKYVLKRALYDIGDGHTLQSANFVLRPAVGYTLEVSELKKTFMIVADSFFFDKFITEMAVFFDQYHYHKQLQSNLDSLNAEMASIIADNDIPFSIQFSLGNGLLDASDSHAVIGLSSTVIESLGELPLFDQEIEARRNGYMARIVETLKSVNKPYELVKAKSIFVRDLDIYNRRLTHKLIRKFVNRKSEFQRVGEGYVESDSWFAVVEKHAVQPDRLDNFDLSGAVVLDNNGLTKHEIEQGLTKVVAQFKISPFDKETGAPVDVSLEAVLSK